MPPVRPPAGRTARQGCGSQALRGSAAPSPPHSSLACSPAVPPAPSPCSRRRVQRPSPPLSSLPSPPLERSLANQHLLLENAEN